MILISILTLIIAKAIPFLNSSVSALHFTRLTTIVFLFTGILSFNSLYFEIISISNGIGIYSGLFHISTISQYIEIFIFIIGGLILTGWPQILISNVKFNNLNLNNNCNSYVATSDVSSRDYSLVVLFSTLGSSLLIISYDMMAIYISIEAQAFALYVLSAIYRDSEQSISAALKYFLLGGLSSCFILLGIGLIYSYTGSTSLESIFILNSIKDIDQQYIIEGVSLGLILIFIGFLFKISAAPLHHWSPDVYDSTPTIVTTWLTIIPKIAILILLLELQVKIGILGGLQTILVNNNGYIENLGNNSLGSFYLNKNDYFGYFNNLTIGPIKIEEILLLISNNLNNLGIVISGTNSSSITANNGLPVIKTLLIISSILSLIIGSVLGLSQTRIKRLLAYSTISHIGFILLALVINSEQSIDSFIFYIIQYTITNLNLFLVILGITYIINNNNIANILINKVATTNTQDTNLKSKSLHYGAIRSYSTSTSTSTSTSKSNTNSSTLDFIVQDLKYINELKGLFFNNPLISISLAISLFSMAGIPPLIGFFSKQFVLYSAIENGYYLVSIISIIVSVISCSYYLKLIKVLFTDTSSSTGADINENEEIIAAPQQADENSNSNQISTNSAIVAHTEQLKTNAINSLPQRNVDIFLLTNTHSYLISTLTFFILFFFIKPSIILNSTQLLSLSLFIT